jgi:cold shock CspA family protein
VASTGVQGNSFSESPSLSADGRFVAFTSYAWNLAPGDTNGSADVFVHDRDADGDGICDEPGAIATHRVSVRSTGVQGNRSSGSSWLSADGRFVAFASGASTLVPGDTNGTYDVFVHDRLGIVEKVCGGFAVTMLGTPGPDVLVGTPGPDVIHGWWGNDVIRGVGGDDILCGSFGNDTLLTARKPHSTSSALSISSTAVPRVGTL